MIIVDRVTKTYGGQEALATTTFEFRSASTTVLLGPSGCGKSTLLRIILGLIRPDSGSVVIDGAELSAVNVDAVRHKVGYVIQDGGLFPHMTAAENVTLLARHLRLAGESVDSRLRELGDLAQLPANMLARYPAELSGGQRQRVGLMRALMLDPPTLLLDEPLGALDPITRNELQDQLKAIFQRLKKTVVLVTHDLVEAAYLGDTIALMRSGRIVQAGSLTELADQPADPYVTEFLNAQRRPAILEGAEA